MKLWLINTEWMSIWSRFPLLSLFQGLHINNNNITQHNVLPTLLLSAIFRQSLHYQLHQSVQNKGLINFIFHCSFTRKLMCGSCRTSTDYEENIINYAHSDMILTQFEKALERMQCKFPHLLVEAGTLPDLNREKLGHQRGHSSPFTQLFLLKTTLASPIEQGSS